MKCPNCGAPAAEGATDCEKCGVVFAKLKARKEREAAEALAAAQAPETPASLPDPWLVRGVAAGAVLAWMLILALYYRHRLAHIKVKVPEGYPTGEFVEMRDQTTGDMKRMPIRRLVAPHPAPPASAPPVDGD